MMNLEKTFDVYYDQEVSTSVLHLPFNSSKSMLLLLPDNSSMLSGLEDVLCSNHVTKWLKWMKPRLEELKASSLGNRIQWPVK